MEHFLRMDLEEIHFYRRLLYRKFNVNKLLTLIPYYFTMDPLTAHPLLTSPVAWLGALAAIIALFVTARFSFIRPITRWYYGIRMEHHGVGRFTYRNVLRVLGPAAMWQCLLMDGLKTILVFSILAGLWPTPMLAFKGAWVLALGISALAGWASNAADAWVEEEIWSKESSYPVQRQRVQIRFQNPFHF
jgi:hypothetical protein